MGRKVVCLFTLFAFLVFSYSCYSIKEKKVETVAKWKVQKAAKVKVLAVMKKNGERIEFLKGNPGKILKSGVEVKKVKKVADELSLDKTEIKEIKRQTDQTFLVMTKDGKMLLFDEFQEKEGKYIFKRFFNKYEKMFFPFSELEWIKVKKFNLGNTIFLSIGILAGLWVAALGIWFISGGPFRVVLKGLGSNR